MAEPRQVWARDGKWGETVVITFAKNRNRDGYRVAVAADAPCTVKLVASAVADQDEPVEESDGV